MIKFEKLKYIILNAIILLIIAQFDIVYFNSNFALLVIPILTLFLIWQNYFLKSKFLFVLLIFIGSHFAFLIGFGGTFSICAITALAFYAIKRSRIGEFFFHDSLVKFLFSLLIIFSVAGWIFKSQLNTIQLLFSVLTFFSLLLMFLLSSKIEWTHLRIKIFVSILSVIMVYSLFTAIANTFHLMPFPSTLWSSYSVSNEPGGSFFYSMLWRPTTAIGAMYFSFLFPFYISKVYGISGGSFKNLVIVGLISSALVCILGFSKSHSVALLFGFITIPFLLLYVIKYKAPILKNFLKFIFFAAIIFLITEPVFHYETLLKRFEEQPELATSFFEDPFLMKNTSREESFSLGMKSLAREDWMIGYGYANAGLNRIAWLGKENLQIVKKDFHNTYYSLPQIFGWIGSVAYLAIFIMTILRMRIIMTDYRVNIEFRIFAFSFLMLFIIHLITEYSITAFSSPNYLMMLFILLGFANSLYYNYKLGKLGLQSELK